jgi:hypothetical protein
MQLGKLALRLPLADVLRDQQQQNGLVLEPVTGRGSHFFLPYRDFAAVKKPSRSH